MATKIDMGTTFSNKHTILTQVELILNPYDRSDITLYQAPDWSEWRVRQWGIGSDANFIDYRVVSDSRFSGCLALEEISRNF